MYGWCTLCAHNVLALSAVIAKLAHHLGRIHRKRRAKAFIAPGTGDDIGPVFGTDPVLVGVDNFVQRGRIDQPLAGQNRLERLDP